MPQPIPRASSEITPQWLNEALPADVRAGATIAAVDIQVIGEGVGFVGEVARVRLTYDRPAPGAPPSVISKVPTANEGFRRLGTALGLYQRENAFFAHAAAETPMRIPACYYRFGDPATETFALLIEDLAPMRPGNQLASCSMAEARLALEAAAALHATWWNSPRLDAFASWLPGAGDPYFLFLEMAFRQAIPAFNAIYGDLVGPEIRRLVDAYADNYQRLVANLATDAVTLVHGDYRLDNMLFGDNPGDPPIAIIDWQLPFRSIPQWDIAYFLAGNFDPGVRRANQEDLLRAYHEALLRNGVIGYSFEDCWRDYRKAALVLIGYMVTGAADVDPETLNDRGRELMDRMFSRYGEAVLDLEAAEFLA
jgi:hypothetical protein